MTKPGTNTILTDQVDWTEKRLRTFKRRRGCSSTRRICIACREVTIHPNDANYPTRHCKKCLPSQGAGTPWTPARPGHKAPGPLEKSAGLPPQAPPARMLQVSVPEEESRDAEGTQATREARARLLKAREHSLQGFRKSRTEINERMQMLWKEGTGGERAQSARGNGAREAGAARPDESAGADRGVEAQRDARPLTVSLGEFLKAPLRPADPRSEDPAQAA